MTPAWQEALIVIGVLMLVAVIAAAMLVQPSHDESGTGSWNDAR